MKIKPTHQNAISGPQAVNELAEHFRCKPTRTTVLATVFDWYFIPRSQSRIDKAQKVLTELRTIKDEYPLWFWAVYTYLILKKEPLASVPPPD